MVVTFALYYRGDFFKKPRCQAVAIPPTSPPISRTQNLGQTLTGCVQ